jgi:GT2 family glycosyltransferase
MGHTMKNNPLVYVVTPVFNSREHTRAFLSSLKKQSYKNFRVVIVDDGSTDGTDEMVNKFFPEVILIKGNGKLWWSGGTNLGVKRAIKDKADFVITINDDVVIAKQYVRSLVECAKLNPSSLIGSKIVYKDDKNKVWYAGADFDVKTGNLKHRMGKLSDFSGTVESEWLTGMGVMIPIEVFKKVGLYNEKEYPQYFGDADFSLRAKTAKYKLLVNNDIFLVSDLKSNWLDRSLSKPKISFVKDLFFSKRSPYQISKRFKFYKKYWPGNKIRPLYRLYLFEMVPIYRSWLIQYIRKIKNRGNS